VIDDDVPPSRGAAPDASTDRLERAENLSMLVRITAMDGFDKTLKKWRVVHAAYRR
jgi:hypothetical protein